MLRVKCLASIIGGAVIFFASTTLGAELPEINIDGGVVRGVNDDGVAVYKGIPFAAPPVGELRWKAPQKVIPWQGVLQANHFRDACTQIRFPDTGPIENGVGAMSEDCLYLNIWAPMNTKEKDLPVMVWIHGGGFAIGAPHMKSYTGENFAKQGVILVSIGYRLGPFGFMAHPELSAENERGVSGNYGLLDQIAALRWVKNNIGKFGGNPENVTIFGESAGAISVSLLCASPLANGLFQKAISQSGGSFTPAEFSQLDGGGMRSLKQAEAEGVAFAKRMKANNLAELRKMPGEAFLKDHSANMGGFWSNQDGYVVAGDPVEMYEQGKFNNVDVLIGTNSDEGAMFIHPPFKAKNQIDNAQKMFGTMSREALKVYPATDDATALQSSRNIFRDTVFAWPTYMWATLQSKQGKSKVFAYYFDQRQPPMKSGRPLSGASHGDDINYVFGHLDENIEYLYTDDDRKLSDMMMSSWINFAKNGNPESALIPKWPQYKSGNNDVMHFHDSQAKIGNLENRAQLDFLTLFFTAFRKKAIEKSGNTAIEIQVGNQTLNAVLYDNAAAKSLIAQLPVTLEFRDYNRSEKIANPPQKLSTQGAPAGFDPAPGDITYYAPWGNLAIFYRDFGYSNGLLSLGKIEGNLKAISGSQPIKMTIKLK